MDRGGFVAFERGAHATDMGCSWLRSGAHAHLDLVTSSCVNRFIIALVVEVKLHVQYSFAEPGKAGLICAMASNGHPDEWPLYGNTPLC